MKKEEELVLSVTNFLVNHKILSDYEAHELFDLFHTSEIETFIEFLLEENIIERSKLLKALGEFYNLNSFDVNGYFFEHHLLTMFPKDIMLRNAFIPLELDVNMLIVVTSNPDNDELLEIIGNYVSYDIRFMIGIRHDICDAVKEFSDTDPNVVRKDKDLQKKRKLIREEKELEIIVDIDNIKIK